MCPFACAGRNCPSGSGSVAIGTECSVQEQGEPNSPDAISESVILRLLEPSGKTLKNRDARFVVVIDGQDHWSRHGGSGATDEVGQLVCHFRNELVGETGSDKELEVYLASPSGEKLQALCDISQFSPGQVLDLGDIYMQPAGLLAAGYVLDPTGGAVSGGDVTIEVQRPGYWFPVITAELDAEGHFFIYDMLHVDKMRLVAKKRGYACSDWIPFRRGDRALELRLHWGSAIEGRVALTREHMAESITIKLRAVEDSGDGPVTYLHGLSLHEDGCFYGNDLPPGVYTVVVQSRPTHECLVEVGNIELMPKQTNRDSRLCGIVLPLARPMREK